MKKKEKTLGQIKRGIDEAEQDKEEIKVFAEKVDVVPEKKNSYGYIRIAMIGATIVLFALALIERSKIMALIAGLGFLLLIVEYTIGGKIK